jgi:glycine/D-amino acid oxidase-like deaminating enzyme
MKAKTISLAKQVTVKYDVDVVVAGGGPAGCCAAFAAAREGASVVLLEAMSALGGMFSMGYVQGWCGFHDQEKFIHRGMAEIIRHRLYDGCVDEPLDSIQSLRGIDPEKMKRILDDLAEEFGVTVLFHTSVAEVVKSDDGTVEAVLAASKDGLKAFKAKVFVDCTGDADLAAWAGAKYHYGDEDGDVQPVSHCFCISNVDTEEAVRTRPEGFQQTVVNDSKYDLVKDDFFGIGGAIGPKTHYFNAGHQWDVDNTDTASLSLALKTGRRLAKQFYDSFREYVPAGFDKSFLAATAPLLGVRETRRIVGDYVLNVDDYWARRRFDDEISLNCFFIDIHPSWKNRQLEREGKWSWAKEKNDSRYAPGEFHGIPYRCLIPKGLRNVLVAGRSVSADRETLSAIRVMPPCMTMGEAAGVAAVHALKNHKCDVHAVDINKLRSSLKKHGAFLP